MCITVAGFVVALLRGFGSLITGVFQAVVAHMLWLASIHRLDLFPRYSLGKMKKNCTCHPAVVKKTQCQLIVVAGDGKGRQGC